MYNDTIKAENKIITSDDLAQIFQMMGETLKRYKNISNQENQKNKNLQLFEQTYSFKDEGSKMKVVVDFYDNTNITFDNYENFMSVFYRRINEIKTMNVYYILNYTIITSQPNRTRNFYSQSIQMYITENKISITLNLKSEDPKLEDLYIFIKNKVLTAPEKYDEIIKNRNKITNIVTYSMGLIPAIIIITLLLFVPTLNKIFLKGYIVYPICVLLLAYVIGNIAASTKLDKYYEPIVPDKKSAGFDKNYQRIYKDDIDSFVNTSEILIGKKYNNLENRKIIKSEYEKYKMFLPKRLIILLIATIIVVIIGFFIS